MKAGRRSHVTWVEKVRLSETWLGRGYRIKCSCGWASNPTTYTEAASKQSLHLQLVQLRKAATR